MQNRLSMVSENINRDNNENMYTGPEIQVGIITDGPAHVNLSANGFEVSNLLIGEGFHWQQTVTAKFNGACEKLEKPQGNIHIMNRLPLEQYLESVIASEMNPSAPIEFMKAHAIISRSWAMKKIKHQQHNGDCSSRISAIKTSCGNEQAPLNTPVHDFVSWEEADTHTGFDVCSDDHCQRYQGVPAQPARSAIEAVKSTRGLVLADRKGEIVDARFSKCCGGRTEIFSSCWNDTDKHYLISQQDPWCNLSDMPVSLRDKLLQSALKDYDKITSDFRDWHTFVNKEKLRKRLIERYSIDIGKIVHLFAKERGKSGRITRLEIIGDNGAATIGKTLAIRRLLASDCLKSSWFEAEEQDDGFTLHGHGWGHGVGLCQIGAARMAFEGKSCEDILGFYYPGTALESTYMQM